MGVQNRVVITGIGVVTPLGGDVDSYWEGLVQGKSGIDSIDSFDVTDFSTQFAGQCHNFSTDVLNPKELRRTARFILMALEAANQALNMSKLCIEDDADRIGVEIGSGIGGIEILDKASHMLHTRGPGKLSPFTVPMMICDMAAGQVAIRFGARGPNSCSVTACASAANSMGNAYRLIQSGSAKAMICGGAEACVTPLGLASFCAARSLSSRNDAPQKASRPFDLNRDGFVMGEGAGICIFESLDSALERGATILAEVVGFGSSGDAYHITAPAPEGEGAARAMAIACNDAQIEPSVIDYVNTHGTSTKLGDKNETKAIKTMFKESASEIAISSTKSMTGHLLGAAGAIELVACVKALEYDIVPPTINLETPDPECDLNYTPNQAVERDLQYVMSNSFGFGGHNASLILKSYS